MVAIHHMGSWGSALKSGNADRRNNEACSLSSSPLPTDIDLHCNNLLYQLCYGCCLGGWWETPQCFCLTVGQITIYSNITGNWEQHFPCCIDSIWILSTLFKQTSVPVQLWDSMSFLLHTYMVACSIVIVKNIWVIYIIQKKNWTYQPLIYSKPIIFQESINSGCYPWNDTFLNDIGHIGCMLETND